MPMDASAVLWAYMVKVSPSFTLMPHGTVRWQSSVRIRLTAPWVSKRGVMVTSPFTTYQPAGRSYHCCRYRKILDNNAFQHRVFGAEALLAVHVQIAHGGLLDSVVHGNAQRPCVAALAVFCLDGEGGGSRRSGYAADFSGFSFRFKPAGSTPSSMLHVMGAVLMAVRVWL